MHKLKAGFYDRLYMFLTPLAYSIFVAAFGLALNLLMPKMGLDLRHSGG
jgi:hypothetical protein